MLPNPLHPAVVHFPLVLAVLFPLAAAAALLVARRAGAGRGAWTAVAVMALLMTLSAWVSIRTGEQQEEVVEDVVGESALHGHEEAAEAFLLGSALLAAIVLVGLVPGVAGRTGRWVTLPAGLVVLGLAVNVGDSGGKLVYVHGAASAYVGADRSAGAEPGVRAAGGSEHDDDEDEEGRRARP